MEVYRGVAITDGVNRNNQLMPLDTIIKAYRDSWDDFIPMNLGHDRTKPIGYSAMTGIYMEPGRAYLTNSVSIAETREEHRELRKMIAAYDDRVFCKERRAEIDALAESLGGALSDGAGVAPVGQAVAIEDKGIVERVFPELAEMMEDGLIDARELEPVYAKSSNGERGALVPGVYRKGGYLLFAHRFFRRSLSIRNTTNEEFFNAFEKIRNDGTVDMRLAIDMDMIGLSGTESLEAELQYIRGPRFDDDLSRIPEGVTCHENEHYDNIFSNLLSTQFYWHIQDGIRTFECEELCDRENIVRDGGETRLWGCRYVHSMIDPGTGSPSHLDGAIRIYDDGQIIERIDPKTDISKYGKNSEYIKLWRIDNAFPVSVWKELISAFYRDNGLIGEYFGGVDEKFEQIKREREEAGKKRPDRSESVKLAEGDGARIYFKYTDRFDMPPGDDVEVDNKNSFISADGEEVGILEADAVALLECLKDRGLGLRVPDIPVVEFEDTVVNFPMLRCGSLCVADAVISAVGGLCRAWMKEGNDRLISFGITVNSGDKACRVSFAGHVNDLAGLLDAVPKLAGTEIEEWVDAVYRENNRFKKGEDRPDKFRMIHGDEVRFDRAML